MYVTMPTNCQIKELVRTRLKKCLILLSNVRWNCKTVQHTKFYISNEGWTNCEHYFQDGSNLANYGNISCFVPQHCTFKNKSEFKMHKIAINVKKAQDTMQFHMCQIQMNNSTPSLLMTKDVYTFYKKSAH